MSGEILAAVGKAAVAAGLLKEIYGDLAKPGVAQVGKALGTVIGLGNTVLWPVQLLNERAKLALEANLEAYRKKLEDTPPEAIVAPAPEVAVPIAEKLTYVEDPDLRELYVNLLAKASIEKTQGMAHPSFVNVINNLSPDEAQLLKQFLNGPVPFCSAKLVNPITGFWLQPMDLVFSMREDVKISFPQHLPAYLSNLEGLGVVNIRRDIFVVPVERYEPIEASIRAQVPVNPNYEYSKLQIDRGQIDATAFGVMLMSACMS